MVKKVSYPAYKKALWEAYRTFIPAFLAVIFAQFEAGVDLKEWRAWVLPLLLSALAAGFRAVVKWVRTEKFPLDYSRAIYKIPA